MAGGREKGVESQSERVLQHHWDYSLKQGTTDLKTRVVVDFDKPGLEISVQHEIQSKYLKIVLMSLVVKDTVVGSNNVRGNFFHLGDYISFKVAVLGRVRVVKMPLQFRVGQFISRLIFLVVFRLFLDGVIGEVDELVVNVLEIKCLASCPQVPVPVPVSLKLSVDAGYHHEVSDVELSTVVKEGLVYVGLNNISQVLTILVLCLADQFADISECRQSDMSALVAVLPWLYDPHPFRFTNSLPHKAFVLFILDCPNVISFRDVLKGVFMLNIGKVVKERFEEVLL